MSLADPIRVKVTFDSLHADADGGVTLKLILPPSECARAGVFPLMREIVFDAVFTPEGVVEKQARRL